MALPPRIPIAREAGYRTDTVGRYAEGQFYAVIHGAHRDDHQGPPSREHLGWYVYLHLFDNEGRHRDSDVTMIGTAPFLRGDLRARAEAKLAGLLAALPDLQFGDIAIRPFRVHREGVTFGLVDESEPERGDWAELYPDGLGFGPPWDGSYST